MRKLIIDENFTDGAKVRPPHRKGRRTQLGKTFELPQTTHTREEWCHLFTRPRDNFEVYVLEVGQGSRIQILCKSLTLLDVALFGLEIKDFKARASSYESDAVNLAEL